MRLALRTLARTRSRALEPRPVTRALLPLLGLAIPTLRGLAENLYIGYEPYIVDHSAYKAAFGDHATPLREAIRTTVQWYQAHMALKAQTSVASVASNK